MSSAAKDAAQVLRGAFSIVVTPFEREGRLDEGALAANIERTLDLGYDGVLIGGTYGEFATMTLDERARLFRAAAGAVGGRAGLLLCAAGSDPRGVRELTALAGELGEDYVRNAVAQGFDRMHIVLRHALRNAMGPAVTIIGFQVVVKLSTVVVVERVFAIDGLGTLALDAVFRGDTPVLLGCVMTFALIVVVVNLFVDLAYTWINPRTRAA